MPTVISKRKFVCVNLRENNNKYWDVTLFDNDDVLTEWGRVGYGETNGVHLSTQSKTHSGVGQRFVDKKIDEKYAKGYKEIDAIDASVGNNGKPKIVVSSNLQKIAQEQIVNNHPQTQKLITYLTKVNAHNIYDVTGGKIEYDISDGLLKTARGIITQNAISEARDLLNNIGTQIHKKKFEDNTTISLVENFLTIVPQNMGMRRFTVKSFLPDISAVQKQNDLLDALDASFTAAIKAKPKKEGEKTVEVEKPKVFDCKLELVEDGKIFDRIQKLFNSTSNRVHSSYGMKIKQIYTVEIASVLKSFELNKKRINNVMSLWHGTKHCHVLSILKQGLVVPPSSSSYVTGRMFSDGIYFALQSSKSLNYANGYWGGSKGDKMFMFLCDVALGNYYIPSGPTSKKPPKGYDSYWAKPHKSGVMNDEIVIFNTNQCNLTYLLEF